MPTPALTENQLRLAAETFFKHGRQGYLTLGLSESTFRRHCKRAEELGIFAYTEAKQSALQNKGIHVEGLFVEDDLTLEELLETKRKLSRRKIDAHQQSNLIDVKVSIDGPIGLVIYGDPHLDDDACDIVRFENDLNLVERTEGLMGGHLGDLTNNWVGRLVTKFGDQLATRRHAKMLIDWALKGRSNLFVVSGNHDLWNNGQDLLDWALQGGTTIGKPHGVRLNLKFPKGDDIRIHARHDFPGNSIYNPTHPMRRELAFGLRDHILLAGHRHTDAYSMIAHNGDPYVSHLLRVSGYKMVDDYAEQNRFIEMRFAPSVTLIIDPTASPADKVKPFWDTQAGADYLTWLRKKRK